MNQWVRNTAFGNKRELYKRSKHLWNYHFVISQLQYVVAEILSKLLLIIKGFTKLFLYLTRVAVLVPSSKTKAGEL